MKAPTRKNPMAALEQTTELEIDEMKWVFLQLSLKAEEIHRILALPVESPKTAAIFSDLVQTLRRAIVSKVIDLNTNATTEGDEVVTMWDDKIDQIDQTLTAKVKAYIDADGVKEYLLLNEED